MSTPETDPSVVELALEFSGLQITVRGAPDRAAGFLAQVASLPRGSGSPSVAASTSGYGSPPVEEASFASAGTGAETRDSILASFPDCPHHLLAVANSRLGGTRASSEQRARRAWVAGKWAKAVLDGRVSSPNRTPAIGLQNRFYAVARSSRCNTPRIFTSSTRYFGAIGPLEGSDSVSQAFPSETEARIYLEAAELEVLELN